MNLKFFPHGPPWSVGPLDIPGKTPYSVLYEHMLLWEVHVVQWLITTLKLVGYSLKCELVQLINLIKILIK